MKLVKLGNTGPASGDEEHDRTENRDPESGNRLYGLSSFQVRDGCGAR